MKHVSEHLQQNRHGVLSRGLNKRNLKIKDSRSVRTECEHWRLTEEKVPSLDVAMRRMGCRTNLQLPSFDPVSMVTYLYLGKDHRWCLPLFGSEEGGDRRGQTAARGKSQDQERFGIGGYPQLVWGQRCCSTASRSAKRTELGLDGGLPRNIVVGGKPARKRKEEGGSWGIVSGSCNLPREREGKERRREGSPGTEVSKVRTLDRYQSLNECLLR